MKRRLELGDPDKPYLYLLPLVDALTDAGNSPIQWDERFGVFYATKSGFICGMRDRIDWPVIQRTFDLPREIVYVSDFDAIIDKSSGAEIEGSRERGREPDRGGR